ncbi:MAG: hypothetical protein ACYTG6_02470 [Planctomycetota bacterium]|jgi:hypothetical protein
MKPLPTVLVIACLLAAGLFLYDAQRRPQDATAPPDEEGESARPRLGASALERLEARLRELERRLETQRRELAALRAAGATTPEAEDLERPTDFFAPPPRDPEGNLVIDPRTLDSLQTHMAEVQRRMREENARGGVDRNIERLGLGLEGDERERLLEAVLAYRKRAETFWQDMRERGITDRSQQLAEMARLREDFVASIRALVGDQDMDRVVDGLIGPGSLPPDSPILPRPWER